MVDCTLPWCTVKVAMGTEDVQANPKPKHTKRTKSKSWALKLVKQAEAHRPKKVPELTLALT